MGSSLPVSRLAVGDASVAAFFFFLSSALYCALGLRLAQGRYLDYYNLAFDFDPVRYLQTFALAPADMGGFKHPLILLLRPLTWVPLAIGLTPKEAAVVVMGLLGGGTVMLLFAFCRGVKIPQPESAALTALYSVTGTQIFTAIITESYGPSGFAIALLWVLTTRRLSNPDAWLGSRLANSIFLAGVTITNAMQAIIAEAAVWWRSGDIVFVLRRTFFFASLAAAIYLILALAIWHDVIWQALQHPVDAAKGVYWLGTHGAKRGFAAILVTFFGYSFVSPYFSVVPLPEGIAMLDFRSFDFPAIGLAAVVLWLGLCATGIAVALISRSSRFLATGMAMAVAFNLLFHLSFQFRGSLYLYAAHAHVLIFMLMALGIGPLLGRFSSRWRAIAVGGLVLLAVLVGMDNLSRAVDFVTRFDTVNAQCAAPCDGPGV